MIFSRKILENSSKADKWPYIIILISSIIYQVRFSGIILQRLITIFPNIYDCSNANRCVDGKIGHNRHVMVYWKLSET